MTKCSLSTLAMATVIAGGLFGASAPALGLVCVTPLGPGMNEVPATHVSAGLGGGSFAGQALGRVGRLGGLDLVRGGGGHGGGATPAPGGGGGGRHTSDPGNQLTPR